LVKQRSGRGNGYSSWEADSIEIPTSVAADEVSDSFLRRICLTDSLISLYG
jgi:hypothetical protein